jgi:hypothetical protein
VLLLRPKDSWLDYVIIGKLGTRDLSVAVQILFFVFDEHFEVLQALDCRENPVILQNCGDMELMGVGNTHGGNILSG